MTGRSSVTLFLNSREPFRFTKGWEEQAYYFTPTRSGSYLFHGLPAGDDNARLYARLYDENGDQIRETAGSGSFQIEVPLMAGTRYKLVVTAMDVGAAAMIEVMENAYGRCCDQPIRLSGESVRYARTIVNARDTHWFSFVAPCDGWYVIRTESDDAALDTRGYLLNGAWRQIAENDDILFPSDGNFRICARLSAGETYFIRVSAGSNQTGTYRLVLSAPDAVNVLPSGITIRNAIVSLKPGESESLSLSIQPDNAQSDTAFASADQSVATVSPGGVITAVSPGKTIIYAYTGFLQAACEVTVEQVLLTGLDAGPDLSVAAGEQTAMEVTYAPANATERSVVFSSADESIALVDQSGVVTGVSEGETTLTVRSEGGAIQASVRVTVTPARPVYRALVLGEQNYENGRVRTGGLNTAQGVADMLANQSIDGRGYQVTLKMDSTREELLAAIDETFRDASSGDVSLFYINCHGDYDSTAWIELHDGTRITAVQLEQLLRGIPGRVVVIIDCCRSGGFLDGRDGADRFVNAVCDAFAAPQSASALASGKYLVMTSAGTDEDSYRRSFTSDNDEDSMATIMARSLCEGAGWDLIGDKICTLKADANKDRQVTLQEIWQYTRRRVLYYLEGTGVQQTVRIWPEGDQTVLFGRK